MGVVDQRNHPSILEIWPMGLDPQPAQSWISPKQHNDVLGSHGLAVKTANQRRTGRKTQRHFIIVPSTLGCILSSLMQPKLERAFKIAHRHGWESLRPSSFGSS